MADHSKTGPSVKKATREILDLFELSPYEKSRENMAAFFKDEIELMRQGRHDEVYKNDRMIIYRYRLAERPNSRTHESYKKMRKPRN